MLIDVERTFETPEGIHLSFQIAGPVIRACAWLLDALIRGTVYFVLSLFTIFGDSGVAFILISIFLLEWFYPVFFEVYKGATPGKRQLGLSVCMDNGSPITWGPSILRNFLRTADFLPFLYMFGLITMLCNRDFKRLGDLVAGTLVVYDDSATTLRVLPEAKADAIPFVLQPVEQRAILDFAERSTNLSSDRQAELASLLSEPGTNKPITKQQLLSYAHWIQSGGQS